MNSTILSGEYIREYIKGKKFSFIGVIMALGIGAIVFGFLDNFGMKLGTEALDDLFLQAFLGPFSEDMRFVNHKENIKIVHTTKLSIFYIYPIPTFTKKWL